MKLFLLERLGFPKQTRKYLRGCKTLRLLCFGVSVIAESESRARELAAQPMPKHGKRVSKYNTIDLPYCWGYDVQPERWLDPALSSCVEHGIPPPDAVEGVASRSFREAGGWQSRVPRRGRKTKTAE